MGSPTKLKDYEMKKLMISLGNFCECPRTEEKGFKPFWMVTRKPMKGQDNTTAPRIRHYREAGAYAEAQRLADLTGRPMLVLKAIDRLDPTGEVS